MIPKRVAIALLAALVLTGAIAAWVTAASKPRYSGPPRPVGYVIVQDGGKFLGQRFDCYREAWGSPTLGYAVCDDLTIPWRNVLVVKGNGS